MQKLIQICDRDNVAVAVIALMQGENLIVAGKEVLIKENIPAGHKVAVKLIDEQQPVIKYGNLIGYSTCRIETGEWVHTHNMRTGLSDLIEYTYEPQKNYNKSTMKRMERQLNRDELTFQGYEREDGRAGIRNELWIIPTVGCVNSVVSAIAKRVSYLKRGTIEEIIAFSHPYGCSQMGEDQENTRKILSALIRHPNTGGVLVVGLGCENSGVEILKDYLGTYDSNRVKFLVCQEHEDEIQEGERLLNELARYAMKFQRVSLPVSRLVVGLKCGGSDGFSGITANPVVGRFSDLLTSLGGTTILTEVPEMFGAETILMNRCQNEELFQKTVQMINGYKEYFTQQGQTIYENPSPGNKQGGISTLEDKSLGCTQKAGESQVCGVYGYGEMVATNGLNLLGGPGNDMVAATALAAAGAQIVLFTTGRGTPFAAPVPTLKISSNTELARRKSGWIDFDAGQVLSEGESIDNLGWKLYEEVLRAASGELTKSEKAGYHDMAILKGGVTL